MKYKVMLMPSKRTIATFSSYNQAWTYADKCMSDMFDKFQSSVDPSPCSGRSGIPDDFYTVEEDVKR